MPKKHKPQQRRGATPSRPASPGAGLAEATRLIRRRRWIDARTLLYSLDRQHPDSFEVLRMLADVNAHLKDAGPYLNACVRLSALRPNDADLLYELAGAYLLNARPALALRTLHVFLELAPQHPQADEARTLADQIEGSLSKLLDEVGLAGVEGLEFATLHEELQLANMRGEYVRVPAIAEQLLARKPDFAPVLNNLSQAYILQDEVEQAIATAQRVLAFEPENVHALGNLVYFHCRQGQIAQAQAYAERLKASQAPAWERWLKVGEALSYLGDDAGVLAALAQVEQDTEPMPTDMGQLYHFAAVAALRQGHEAEARRLWLRAIELNPGLELARANLSDLRKPIGERHAPWPFNFNQWVSQTAINSLLPKVMQHGPHDSPTPGVRAYLAEQPEVAALVPVLLDRGDPQARQFALMLAEAADTPEFAAILADYALSQRGPDAMRNQALQGAMKYNLFPDYKARMWMDGEWRDLELMGFEITGEPLETFSPEVEDLSRRAAEALYARQWARGEQLLRQALAIEPDSPSLLNNLAMAIGNQGQQERAEQMTRELHERFPDYLFARVSVARMLINNGELEAAEELLKPVMKRRRMHFSEAAALFGARIELELERDRPEAARTWFDMWASADPDHPQIAHYQRLLGIRSLPAQGGARRRGAFRR